MEMKPELSLSGQTLREALDAVRALLNKLDRQEALANAVQIVSVVARTYEAMVKTGEVGKNGKGARGHIAKKRAKSRAGLIYGRIQSGKTRGMITSAALAFYNKFRVVVDVTRNNKRPLRQQHKAA